MTPRQARGFLLPTLLLLFSALPVSGAESDPEWDIHQIMVQADFAEAAALYLARLGKNPDGPLADYLFLRVLECAGRAGKRDDAFAKALEIALGADNRVLRARALWTKAGQLFRAGRIREAEETASRLGLLRRWAVLGPFDNEGEAGFSEAYGPEKGLADRRAFMDYGEAVKGKQGTNRWRVLSAEHPLHLIDFSSLFRLSRNVCAYACTYFRAEEPTPCAFRLGSSGAVKVWLNGRPVHAADVYRSAGLDQDATGATLSPGWNEILVKVCQKKGPWTLLFRVTDLAGAPLPLEVHPDPASAVSGAQIASPADPPAEPPFTGAVGFLENRCRESPRPLDRARLAYLLARRGVLDENDRKARTLLHEAVKAEPERAFLRLMLSAEEIDRNRALAQARRARALAPDAALPAFALSRFYGPPKPIRWWGFFSWGGEEAAATQEEYQRIREVEMPDKEESLLGKACEARPGFCEAQKALACFWFRKAGGDPRRTGDVNPGAPFAPEARRALAKALELSGEDVRIRRMLDAFDARDPLERIASARRRLAIDFTDAPSRAALVENLLALGRLEEAAGALGDRLRLNPFDVGAMKEMARAYTAHDAFDRARGCLEMALEVSPEDVGALQALAELHLVKGERAKAIALFEKVLEIRPQMADVSRRIRILSPEAEEEFYASHRADPDPWIRLAFAEEAPAGTDAWVVFKNDVVRVLDNGTAKHFHQRVVKVLTEKGVNENRWVRAWPGRYDYYTRSRGEVKEARVIRADGSSLEGDFREGSSWAEFDDLQEGDVIVFEVKTEEVGEPRYKGYFGLMLLLQDGMAPVRTSRATFLHPAEKPLYFHGVRVEAPPERRSEGGLEAVTWEAKNLPEVKEEPGMPGLFELCPSVHVSTFREWEEVTTWYENLVKDQFESSPEIREAVARAVEGLGTVEEKVDAIYHLVVSDIRYESLDLADHAYRPFKARLTFDRKYGDCKDTAALLKTMLSEAGIASHIVLIRAGRSERIDLSLPSMKIFNHAITFVPGVGEAGLFLDGTARYCGSRELPAMDQGAVAFIVGLGGEGKAVFAPYDGPADNRTVSRMEVFLRGDGSARLKAAFEVRGQDAAGLRRIFQQGTKRAEQMEKRLNQMFGSVQVASLSFSDLSDYNRPVTYEVAFETPSLARFQGREMALKPALHALKLCDRWAPTDTRHHDLILGYPRRNEHEVAIHLPEGWILKKVPAGLARADERASFEIAFGNEEGKVTVRRVFELRAPRIARKDYGAFRTFCEEVDRVEDEEMILVKR